MFFDKTCSILQTTYTKVGGTSKRSYTPIYTDIECNFEIKRQQKPTDTSLGKNEQDSKYIVVVPIQYNLVRENYVVELTDPDLGIIGKFTISDVQADRSVEGYIDCITFIGKVIKGQL